MSYSMGLRAVYLVFGALPASFLAGLFVYIMVELNFEQPLFTLWCCASVAGTAGLWLAVLEGLITFKGYVAVTLALLGLGLAAMAPLPYMFGFDKLVSPGQWLSTLLFVSPILVAMVHIARRLIKVMGSVDPHAPDL